VSAARRPRRGPTAGPPTLDAARARAVAFDLLSRKAWTRRDLYRRLRRRGASAEIAAALVQDLEQRGHLDDRAFAASWTEARVRSRALGPRRLSAELVTRGVARPLVEAALRRTFADTDVAGLARVAAGRRWPALSRLAPATAARRLHDFLIRRGFPADVARRLVRQTAGVSPDDE
jgi:regulatory protein